MSDPVWPWELFFRDVQLRNVLKTCLIIQNARFQGVVQGKYFPAEVIWLIIIIILLVSK